jgi:hypothetical protein
MNLNRLGPLLAVILLATPAQAGIIFSSFGPGDSYDPYEGLGIQGANNDFRLPSLSHGFAFTPLSNANLTQIQVAFFGNNDPAISHLSLELHSADALGNVGALLESFSGLIAPNDPDILTVDSLLRPTLSAGSRYYLIAIPGDSRALIGWDFSFPQVNGRIYQDEGGTVTYSDNDALPAARLIGVSSAPEPSSLVLGSIGLMTVLTWTRLRRAHSKCRATPPTDW